MGDSFPPIPWWHSKFYLFVPCDRCITCEVKGASGAETHFKATIGYILSAESFGIFKSDGRKTRRKMQRKVVIFLSRMVFLPVFSFFCAEGQSLRRVNVQALVHLSSVAKEQVY